MVLGADTPSAYASWWCAAGEWGCDLTRESCEKHGKKCQEYEEIFLLDATMVKDGPTGWKFPLREQCEAVRRSLLRNRDYRSIGKCISSVAQTDALVGRIVATARGARYCEVITPERVRDALAIFSKTWGPYLVPPEAEKVPLDQAAADFQKRFLRALDDHLDVLLATNGTKDRSAPTPTTQAQRENEAKDKDVLRTVLTDKVVSQIRRALDQPNEDAAGAALARAVQSAHAVEATLGRAGSVSPFLDWIALHRADPRSKCMVSFLVKMRDR